MEFGDLKNLIFGGIKPKLEDNQGLSIFAKERAKFEGWLKVELCESLSKYSTDITDITPEKPIEKEKRKRIDVTFKIWAIELKTVNTSYGFENVESKQRPITANIKGILSDIEKLKHTGCTNKAVLFVVFPVTAGYKTWPTHLKKVSASLRKLEAKEFKFKDGIPGIIYFGLV